MLWFSLIVLIPLSAIVAKTASGGWSEFWDTITNPQTAAAIRLTVTQAALVTLMNVVFGTLLAWVLVRDDFFGKRAMEVLIDVPFALPTIVAGLVLLSLYGPRSPIGVDVANTKSAVFLALAFVTVPFVVRTVQPVLEELDPEVEEAAASLGASRFTIFRRIIVPSLAPAIASGAALSFARAISEYGSLVLLSGNLALRTEVTSVRILTYIENGNVAAAAAVATALLVIALVVIVLLDLLQRGWLAVAETARPPAAQGRPQQAQAVDRPTSSGSSRSPTCSCSSPGRSGSSSRTRSQTASTRLRAVFDDPDVRHALALTVRVAVVSVVDQPRLRRRACRSCSCATGSPAGASSAPSSTCRWRCRRSWSASPSCSSTTRATGGSARRSTSAASTSSSPRPASCSPPSSCRCRS